MALLSLFPQMQIVQFFESLDWPSWHCIFKCVLKFYSTGLYSMGIFFHRSSMWALTGLSVVVALWLPLPKTHGFTGSNESFY